MTNGGQMTFVAQLHITAPSTSFDSFVKATRMPTFARQVELTPCRRLLIDDSRRHGVLGAHVSRHLCSYEFAQELI